LLNRRKEGAPVEIAIPAAHYGRCYRGLTRIALVNRPKNPDRTCLSGIPAALSAGKMRRGVPRPTTLA
jgi:hypothetical protein